jgi:hypothetical protein
MWLSGNEDGEVVICCDEKACSPRQITHASRPGEVFDVLYQEAVVGYPITPSMVRTAWKGHQKTHGKKS